MPRQRRAQLHIMERPASSIARQQWMDLADSMFLTVWCEVAEHRYKKVGPDQPSSRSIVSYMNRKALDRPEVAAFEQGYLNSGQPVV